MGIFYLTDTASGVAGASNWSVLFSDEATCTATLVSPVAATATDYDRAFTLPTVPGESNYDGTYTATLSISQTDSQARILAYINRCDSAGASQETQASDEGNTAIPTAGIYSFHFTADFGRTADSDRLRLNLGWINARAYQVTFNLDTEDATFVQTPWADSYTAAIAFSVGTPAFDISTRDVLNASVSLAMQTPAFGIVTRDHYTAVVSLLMDTAQFGVLARDGWLTRYKVPRRHVDNPKTLLRRRLR